ncbi:MAG: transcription termination factor Rho, partial [Proteobacteria bacterium]|nr:transcription termination factor Rho [Pseudomonadota bacterium]
MNENNKNNTLNRKYNKFVKKKDLETNKVNNSQNNNESENMNVNSEANVQVSESSNLKDHSNLEIKGILFFQNDYGKIVQQQAIAEDLPKDVYVSHSQMKKFGIRPGDYIEGFARGPEKNEKLLHLLRVTKVAGMDVEEAKRRPFFNNLTPIFPYEWLKLETTPDVLSTRLIDLVAPIGKGQRSMIVAPPKAGKTWLLQQIANGITQNHPEVKIIVTLIGERPEEVTDMRRKIKGDFYSSNFDELPEEQIKMAEISVEVAKRLAEKGEDVVILMDSLTRLARAYNMAVPPSGKTLSGGFDPSALYPPKRFFGAARKFEEGGSLTIIATSLVDTGSKMDDVIFEEFKGTGNQELRLDRSLAERRIFPSIDIKGSGTRNEDKILSPQTLENIFRLRRRVDLLQE